MGFITGFRNKYASDEPQREEPVADASLMMDKSSMCRHFIITKRQKPLKFSDISIKSLDYDYVDTEAAATIFGSMTETMLVLDKLCKAGESGVWYREVNITGQVEEHLYVYVLNAKSMKYVGYNKNRGCIYFTPYQYNAFKCNNLTDALQFGLNYIPKDTLNDLQIVDLKESDSEYVRVYLFYNRKDHENCDKMLDNWFRYGDDEAFKKFSNIIERLSANNDCDIFKREVLKLMGARRYLTNRDDTESKEFTKNALINVFMKLVSVKASDETVSVDDTLYLEWFIRNKLMTADEVRWLVKTKWFSKTSTKIHQHFGI